MGSTSMGIDWIKPLALAAVAGAMGTIYSLTKYLSWPYQITTTTTSTTRVTTVRTSSVKSTEQSYQQDLDEKKLDLVQYFKEKFPEVGDEIVVITAPEEALGKVTLLEVKLCDTRCQEHVSSVLKRFRRHIKFVGVHPHTTSRGKDASGNPRVPSVTEVDWRCRRANVLLYMSSEGVQEFGAFKAGLEFAMQSLAVLPFMGVHTQIKVESAPAPAGSFLLRPQTGRNRSRSLDIAPPQIAALQRSDSGLVVD